MKHRSYVDLGIEFSRNGWGFDTPDDMHEAIKLLKHEDRALSLLAAAVHFLKEIHICQQLICNRIDKVVTQTDHSTHKEHPVSDGMIRSFRVALGDRLISTMDTSTLSVRARKALRLGRFEMTSELTPESLRGLPNCGETTVIEIIEWAHK